MVGAFALLLAKTNAKIFLYWHSDIVKQNIFIKNNGECYRKVAYKKILQSYFLLL